MRPYSVRASALFETNHNAHSLKGNGISIYTPLKINFLCGCAARCAERLGLSGKFSLIFCGCAAKFEAQPRRIEEKQFRRGEAIAAHRAAQPQKTNPLTFVDTNSTLSD